MEPITRTEQYLSRIAGDDCDIPEYPITRTEQYLERIAKGGGVGTGAVIDVTIAGQSLVDENGIAAVDNIGQSISITVTGTDPVIQASSNARYICGEVATLDFTPCSVGICEVIFTSGTTPTVMTPLPQTVQMPEWFVVEANHTYEISVIDGVYGAVMVW